jgi:hypothetical protein
MCAKVCTQPDFKIADRPGSLQGKGTEMPCRWNLLSPPASLSIALDSHQAVNKIYLQRRLRMEKMRKYMVVHRDPDTPWEQVEANWARLANIEHAIWVRTCFNREHGMRFCVWMAQNEDELKKVFSDLEISWEWLIEVEETVPDLWGKDKWEEHLEAEAVASTLGF